MTGDKKALRKAFKALRDGLPPEERDRASRIICQRIAHWATSRRFRQVAVFHPLGSEVDLRPLVQEHPGWLFYFPKVTTTSPPRLAWGTEPLEAGPWGLQEPVIAQHFLPPVALVLVPGLAFDRQGFRLGYGGGFYDALLPHLPKETTTLGVAFDAQLTDALPVDPLDQAVDGLLTERRLVWFDSESPIP